VSAPDRAKDPRRVALTLSDHDKVMDDFRSDYGMNLPYTSSKPKTEHERHVENFNSDFGA